LFVDWESFGHHTAFINSSEYKSFKTIFNQLFDLKTAETFSSIIPPVLSDQTVLNKITVFTNWTSDSTAAFRAPVTEIAFFALPNGGEESKQAIGDALSYVTKTILIVGKAWGSAIGWGVLSLPCPLLFIDP